MYTAILEQFYKKARDTTKKPIDKLKRYSKDNSVTRQDRKKKGTKD